MNRYEIEQEIKRRARYEIYRTNPSVWLIERLGEDPTNFKWSAIDPKYSQHQWDGDKDPLFNAWLDLANGRRRIAIESASGVGKTYFLSRLVLWFLDVYEDSLVVTTAPNESQLKHNLWSEIGKAKDKFKRIRPNLRLKTLDLKPEGNNPSERITTQDSHQAIGRVAGVGANEQAATKMQGFHREHMLIILEEMAGIHPAIITSLKNTCTGKNNLMLGVGNPDSELDPLHQFAILPDSKLYRISALDHPNVVLGKDLIMGAVTDTSIQSRLDEYGEDSPLYLSRVRGITPNESDNTLIRKSWIDLCTETHKDYIGELQGGYSAVGVDVSNSENGDKAALVWGTGNRIISIQEFQCPNATHLAYNMLYQDHEIQTMQQDRRKFNELRNLGTLKLQDYGIEGQYIGIDAVGVGVATVNAFRDANYDVQALQGAEWKEIIPMDEYGKPLYHFNSLRSQMMWELREDVRCARLVFQLPEAIMKQVRLELTVARFTHKEGAIAVESKEAIKKRLGGKSPNVADALAYWNWVRKGYRVNKTIFLPMSGGR